VTFANERGLPEIYNGRISADDAAAIVVFIHDDVWLDDYFVANRVIEGLHRYDIIGVAGNRRRLPNQSGWAFINAERVLDDHENLSGSIAHATGPFGPISFFGDVPADCELLDGVFLAANTEALRRADVTFDPRFSFHLYDVDFCRRARQQGLRLGTWPICLTHRSGGSFRTAEWKAGYDLYIEKWGS